MNKKYSVTTFWLVTVEQKTHVNGECVFVKYVRRWKRVGKDYFRTKKEAVKFVSSLALHYVKGTIRREAN